VLDEDAMRAGAAMYASVALEFLANGVGEGAVVG
jgi:hypothetical protein